MGNFVKIFISLVLFVFQFPAFAVYNANITGEVGGVYAYTDGDYIFFFLKNQSISHPSCGTSYFVIDSDTPVERRKVLYARLLLAYSTHEQVTIGYDSVGSCAQGQLRVYRIG